MAGAAKRFVHGRLGSHEQIGITSHVSGDQDRLADLLIGSGDLRVAGRESSRRPFAMGTKPAALSVHHMVLSFGDVMADVIDQGKAELLWACIKNLKEGLFCSVHDKL